MSTFATAAAGRLMLACTPVQTLSQGRGMTTASGFFFERGTQLYVVTAGHVVADEASGHAPDALSVQVHLDAQDLTAMQSLRLPLYDDGLSRWHQGRDIGGAIDVAVVEIDRAQLPPVHALQALGMADLAAEQAGAGEPWDIGDPLVIPGFPLGFHDLVYHLPVVRSAAIASAYGVRFQGKGFFLTDGRTHRGSSGSPVLCRVSGDDGGSGWRLLGVHSSRMDMSGRDAAIDESLGLNCAWYADILRTLTDPADPAEPAAPDDGSAA